MSQKPVPILPEDAPRVGEVYRHYKGNLYKVIDFALHSTDEWVVVYQGLYKDTAAKLFTRPVSEWFEIVEWQGNRVPRFKKE